MRQQPVSLAPTTILPDAANLFRRMIAADSLQSLDESHLVLYKKAMGLEERSRDFYQEQAAASSDSTNGNLFRLIAAEEEKHYWLLQNIYELVLRPQTWVENGEFNHLEEY
jgi:rubrerythrin